MIASRAILTARPTGPEKKATASDGSERAADDAARSRDGAGVVTTVELNRAPFEEGVGARSAGAHSWWNYLADLRRDVPRRRGERPAGRSGAGALRRIDPGAAKVGPDARHLGNVRHRDAAHARAAELGQHGVVDLLAGDGVRRIATARLRQRQLRRRLRQVVDDEVLREARHAVVAGELRHREALHAEERDGRALDLRDLDDPEGESALLERVRVPRARHPEGGLLVQEGSLRRSRGDLRVDQALTVPAVDHRGVLQELRVRYAVAVRVERAALRRLEDVAAEAGEERVHVVRVPARALLNGDPQVVAALPLEGQRLLLELRPGLRNLH